MRVRRAGRWIAAPAALAGAWLCAMGGCSLNDLRSDERMERGLVLILPGIEGPSALNWNLARGLEEGGVACGIEVFDWGVQVPGGALINLADYERNRWMAGRIRDRIIDYRRSHPRRCIHVIGHSGGGGVAVLAVESLPEDTQVSTLILLAAAISPAHDLTTALHRTQHGVFNYYSPLDAVFLRAGTLVAGTIDRHHGEAAGATGFQVPPDDGSPSAAVYGRKLKQIKWSPQMGWHAHFGGHTDWTHRPFVRHYLAALVRELSEWRPSRAEEPAPRPRRSESVAGAAEETRASIPAVIDPAE